MSFEPLPRLTPEEINEFFPAHTGSPEAGVFEVGLVLGGTVSAGCFTAGVLDFLIEALDRWTVAKRLDNDSGAGVPNHRVVIRVVSGASGGGVTGAAFAKAIAHAVAPVTSDRTSPGQTQAGQNPLYDLWVNNFNLPDFLTTEDLGAGRPLKSALNPAPIDRAADALVRYQGGQLGMLGTPAVRDYVPDKLTLFLTLTNLRGVPYQVELGSGRLAQSFIDHADFVRMAVATRGADIRPRPDEFGVSEDAAGSQFVGWHVAAEFGKATGAFPVGFPPSELKRPMRHYRYRVVADAVTGKVRPLNPDWTALAEDGFLPNAYKFLAVDGGATNNQPMELARTFLAGHLGRNPRSGGAANRAVVLVDPFADEARLGPEAFKGLFSSFGSLAKTWVDQARFSTADLTLAADEDVFSRFMVTPSRRSGAGLLMGGRATASAGFGGFMGFLHRAYRHHDFMLGRKACQEFLREEFTLTSVNNLFNDWRGAHYTDEYRNTKNELQIIPLMKEIRDPLPDPDWPQGLLDTEDLRNQLDGRVGAVVGALKRENVEDWFARAWFWLAEWKIRGEITKSLVERVAKEAALWKL